MKMEKRPKVGIGVIVIKDGKVLHGKRKNAHGAGEWCFPGGHLEFGESFEECARRETLEETGIKIKNIRLGTVTNDIFEKEDKHYITVYMVADHESGEAKVMEPEKCERWEWSGWDNPPKPIFLPETNLRKTGFDPFKRTR